jgi:hypothetical protein
MTTEHATNRNVVITGAGGGVGVLNLFSPSSSKGQVPWSARCTTRRRYDPYPSLSVPAALRIGQSSLGAAVVSLPGCLAGTDPGRQLTG